MHKDVSLGVAWRSEPRIFYSPQVTLAVFREQT